MTIDPAAWELMKWLVVGVFLLIFALLWILYEKIEGVQKYASTRYHELSNKMLPLIGHVEDILDRLKGKR